MPKELDSQQQSKCKGQGEAMRVMDTQADGLPPKP